MNTQKHILACKIFEDEFKAVISDKHEIIVHWIDAALHAKPEKMKDELTTTLSTIDMVNSKVNFLFGNGCHPDMCAIANECGAVLPEEKNCIHAFLGTEKTKALEQNRTMIISPGWLNAWQSIVDGLGWDDVDVRINMGRYDKILLLDPGLVPIDDEALLIFYDQVQVPVEVMGITLDHFSRFVSNLILSTSSINY